MTINKKPLLLTLALLMAAAGSTAAQQTPRELSWNDCVQETLANNPGLQAKKLAIEQNKYLYLAGYNVYLPKINLSHSVSRSGGDNTPASTLWGLSASASEPLFDLRALSSIRSSKIDYDKAYADYGVESARLRQTLYSAFVNLVYAQENVAAQNKVLTIREHDSQLIKLKYDSGMESRGNMMFADAQSALSKANVLQAERSLDSARRTLLTHMGFSEFRPIVAKAVLTVPDYNFAAADVKKLIGDIPQVVSQKKSVESLKERLLSAKYNMYPTLDANQSLGWSGRSEFPGTQRWSLGLSLNLPIFSNGITSYANNTKAADRALKSGEASLKDLEGTLENDILSGYNDFLNAKDTALVNLTVLNANEERYNESQIKYQAGQMSFIDLETIEQSMVDAQLGQLRLFRDANASKISLESLLGVGLEQ